MSYPYLIYERQFFRLDLDLEEKFLSYFPNLKFNFPGLDQM